MDIIPLFPPSQTMRGLLAGLAMLGLVTLCACWWLLYRASVDGRLAVRSARWIWLAWSLPFVAGPPLYSRDVYAYAAQGQLAQHGMDPSTTGISALNRLGLGRYVTAVDPRWHETHAPYGSTAVGVERIAAAVGGGPTGAVVVFRVVAILSVVAMVTLVTRLVAGPGGLPGRGRPGMGTGGTGTSGTGTSGTGTSGTGTSGTGTGGTGTGGTGTGGTAVSAAIVLAALNPVTVIHLEGGAHLDAFAAALLVAALVVDRADWRGHTYAAVALACLAGTVKVTAFLGLAWLLVAHARRRREDGVAGRRSATLGAARAVVADLLVATVVAVASMLAVGFGPTWLKALTTSGTLRTEVAPAAIAAHVLSVAGRLVGISGHDDAVLAGCRAVALLAVAAFVGWMLVRTALGRSPLPRHRPADNQPADNAPGDSPAGADLGDGRSAPLVVLGYGSLAVALGSPVAYPWYLALALAPLAALIGLDSRGTTAARRILMIASIWLCVSAAAPLGPTWHLLGRHPWALAVAVVGATLVAVTAAAWPRGRTGGPAGGPRATRTSTP
jgi:hypothetical protein